MEYRQFGDTWVVRMDRGEEILESLLSLCRREQITLASVEALGAVDRAVVGLYDLESRAFLPTEFNEPMEIAQLCGTVAQQDGQPCLHLHVTLCGRDAVAHGGHAKLLRVSATCEMLLRRLPGQLERKADAETGLNLFSFSGNEP